jgi:hypothetical protein
MGGFQTFHFILDMSVHFVCQTANDHVLRELRIQHISTVTPNFRITARVVH